MATAQILVVEDEKIVARNIQERLKSFGYAVSGVASSGEEAIRKADKLQPDLVLMDIMLKGEMDGVQAATEIRERFHIPVIYLTAFADEYTLQRASITEPFGYILKPFEERELHTIIEMALYKHQMEKKLKRSEQWLGKLLKTIGDAVIAADHKGAVTFMNPVAEALTGWRQEDALGKDLSEVFNTTSEKMSGLAEMLSLKGLLQGGAGGFSSQPVLIAKDGTETPIDSSAALMKDDHGNITGLILIFRNAASRLRAEEQLLHDAFHDPLTGLPNRALFMDRLGHAVARAKRRGDYLFAVLFLDLDRFKTINDSLGHAIGDELLGAVARRLEACVRPGDTVARLSGDEFAILLQDIEDVNAVRQVADRIHKELAAPLVLQGQEVMTTASIGIALSETGYERPEDILRDADRAMYRAKALGKARYEVFGSAKHLQTVERMQLETDLRRALTRDDFQFCYQPIVSLESGTLSGFEALLRWRHPERGIVSPDDFIPVAEATGLIVYIGQWAIREACRQIQVWQGQFPDEPLAISVNLSSVQLSQPGLVEEIGRVLDETGIDGKHLKLEITESVLVDNAESAVVTLRQIKALNIRLCLDDFGTGYSSLSYLHRLPIDTIKIDRSFVSTLGMDEDNPEIARTIVMLAHNLGIDVIAEGIETVEQMERLRDLRCDFGQGNYFSMPLDSAGAAALIAAKPRW
jgi:diguanylate cyclase (GGDEF)-like protein/PAS domain S-box-containing protein